MSGAFIGLNPQNLDRSCPPIKPTTTDQGGKGTETNSSATLSTLGVNIRVSEVSPLIHGVSSSKQAVRTGEPFKTEKQSTCEVLPEGLIQAMHEEAKKVTQRIIVQCKNFVEMSSDEICQHLQTLNLNECFENFLSEYEGKYHSTISSKLNKLIFKNLISANYKAALKISCSHFGDPVKVNDALMTFKKYLIIAKENQKDLQEVYNNRSLLDEYIRKNFFPEKPSIEVDSEDPEIEEMEKILEGVFESFAKNVKEAINIVYEAGSNKKIEKTTSIQPLTEGQKQACNKVVDTIVQKFIKSTNPIEIFPYFTNDLYLKKLYSEFSHNIDLNKIFSKYVTSDLCKNGMEQANIAMFVKDEFFNRLSKTLMTQRKERDKKGLKPNTQVDLAPNVQEMMSKRNREEDFKLDSSVIWIIHLLQYPVDLPHRNENGWDLNVDTIYNSKKEKNHVLAALLSFIKTLIKEQAVLNLDEQTPQWFFEKDLSKMGKRTIKKREEIRQKYEQGQMTIGGALLEMAVHILSSTFPEGQYSKEIKELVNQFENKEKNPLEFIYSLRDWD